MFNLSTIWTTVLLFFCLFLFVVILVLPKVLKIRNSWWYSIKTFFSLFFLFWIATFSDFSRTSFFWLSCSLSLGFLIKYVQKRTGLGNLYLLIATFFFSFIFLSIGQILLFSLFIIFNFFLFLILFYYQLHMPRAQSIQRSSSFSWLLGGILLVLAFAILFSFIFPFSNLTNDLVISNKSVIQLFEGKNNKLLLLLILTLFVTLFGFMFYLETRYTVKKTRDDKSWLL